jgi:hypothetical protein
MEIQATVFSGHWFQLPNDPNNYFSMPTYIVVEDFLPFVMRAAYYFMVVQVGINQHYYFDALNV